MARRATESAVTIKLEVHFKTKLNLAWTIDLRVIDQSDRTAVQVLIDSAQPVPVGNVKNGGAKLQPSLLAAQIEVLEDGDVFVEIRGASQLWDQCGRVSILPIRRTPEGSRVDIRIVRSVRCL